MSTQFFVETSNHPGDSALLQPRFGTLQLLPFPKTSITFEKEISKSQWDSGKYDNAADSDWENCVRSQSAYFEGDWSIIVLCTMYLLICIFLSKYLYFSYCIAGYVLGRLCSGGRERERNTPFCVELQKTQRFCHSNLTHPSKIAMKPEFKY